MSERLYELLVKGVLLQGILALALVGAVIYLAIVGQVIPDVLIGLAGAAVGFFFGGEVSAKVARTVSQ